MDALTKQDTADFYRLEKVVEAGKNTFVAVGLALTEIRDRKLYRESHPTFEEYCQKRWGWTARRSRQLIAAAAIACEFPDGEVINERAARQLAKIPKEKRKQVVDKAKASGKEVNAVTVRDAAKETIDIDCEGYPIPKGVLDYWNRAEEVQQLLTAVSKIKSRIIKARDDRDLMYAEVNPSCITDLEKVYVAIHCAKPYAVCTTCQGHPETQPDKLCRMCFGRGLISKYRWDRLVPIEIKKIREKGAKK